jgi:hypothetical protein
MRPDSRLFVDPALNQERPVFTAGQPGGKETVMKIDNIDTSNFLAIAREIMERILHTMPLKSSAAEMVAEALFLGDAEIEEKFGESDGYNLYPVVEAENQFGRSVRAECGYGSKAKASWDANPTGGWGTLVMELVFVTCGNHGLQITIYASAEYGGVRDVIVVYDETESSTAWGEIPDRRAHLKKTFANAFPGAALVKVEPWRLDLR